MNLPLVLLNRRRRGGGTVFSPAALFNGGEEGAWYEPSTTTCFTDTGGTTPATYGDGVAYLEDLSGNGNHATQVTVGARPILARVPEGGRRNLLEYTEQFDNAYWTKSNLLAFGSGSVANDAIAPDGSNTADFIVPNTSNAAHGVIRAPGVTSGAQYTISVYAKAGGYNWLFLANIIDGGVYINLSDGSAGTLSAGFSSLTVTPLPNGWYKCSVTYTAAGSNRGIGMYVANADSGVTFTGDGTSGIYIWGAQLETGSTATAYQKVVSEYDITEAGVTSLEYLSFDGSDDYLTAPAAISTASVSLLTGVKGGVNNIGMLWSLESASGFASGAIRHYRNGDANPQLVGSRFPTNASISTDTNPGTLNVFAYLKDGATSQTLRENGTSTGTNTNSVTAFSSGFLFLSASTSSGSPGDFGENDLFCFLLVNRGLTTPEITNTETYLAAKSGVTL